MSSVEVMTTPASAYIRYGPEVEKIEPDEQETFEKIVKAMSRGSEATQKMYGRAVRTSHAKSHGLLKGELRVLSGLPEHLAQGLFATARSYPVIVRLSHVPGSLDDDRRVSTPRGMAIKVLDVEGPKLPGHEGETTQDFVLDTGKFFNTPGAKTFLAQIEPVEAVAPHLPQSVKGAVSTASRLAGQALKAVGVESANLDFFGHPFLHPLGESYFSQAPMRYGNYIAKLGAVPANPETMSLTGTKIEPGDDENALRTIVSAFFRDRGADFEIAVQLCTDLDHMPVENANTEWPEKESAYQPVARLILPSQTAWSEARQSYVDDDLAFSLSHSLEVHRPLGSLMRARIYAYEALSIARRRANGRAIREPRSIDEMPD